MVHVSTLTTSAPSSPASSPKASRTRQSSEAPRSSPSSPLHALTKVNIVGAQGLHGSVTPTKARSATFSSPRPTLSSPGTPEHPPPWARAMSEIVQQNERLECLECLVSDLTETLSVMDRRTKADLQVKQDEIDRLTLLVEHQAKELANQESRLSSFVVQLAAQDQKIQSMKVEYHEELSEISGRINYVEKKALTNAQRLKIEVQKENRVALTEARERDPEMPIESERIIMRRNKWTIKVQQFISWAPSSSNSVLNAAFAAFSIIVTFFVGISPEAPIEQIVAMAAIVSGSNIYYLLLPIFSVIAFLFDNVQSTFFPITLGPVRLEDTAPPTTFPYVAVHRLVFEKKAAIFYGRIFVEGILTILLVWVINHPSLQLWERGMGLLRGYLIDFLADGVQSV